MPERGLTVADLKHAGAAAYDLEPGAPPKAAAGCRSAASTWADPRKLTDAQKAEARRRRAQGATLAELARSYGAGKSTISRRAA
jgi:hypothetical protein